ncbi:ABC transporter permease subunit [Desulfocurvibacter africanus]|uniref:PstA family ABC transporter permease n=1 Tax=Desulfocurvibacter africanus TaxID=873 RepID=UPI002FDA8F42
MSRSGQTSFIIFCWLSALIPMLCVVALLAFLAARGLPTVSAALFFGDTQPLAALLGRAPVWDGIWPACAGTLSLVILSAALAIPVGVACGIHLAEFSTGRSKAALSLGADLLAGVPSIVMGLFGFALILLLRRTLMPDATTCLLLSAACMALLILPYLIKTTQASLEGLPEELRLLGPSLGLTRLQAIRHILLPAAGKGILGGAVLAIGRAAEDTAVILLTGVVANAGLPRGLLDKYEALPFFIFTTAAEHQTVGELNRGFGAALVLLLLTSGIFLGAHLLHATMQRRWGTSA